MIQYRRESKVLQFLYKCLQLITHAIDWWDRFYRWRKRGKSLLTSIQWASGPTDYHVLVLDEYNTVNLYWCLTHIYYHGQAEEFNTGDWIGESWHVFYEELEENPPVMQPNGNHYIDPNHYTFNDRPYDDPSWIDDLWKQPKDPCHEHT